MRRVGLDLIVPFPKRLDEVVVILLDVMIGPLEVTWPLQLRDVQAVLDIFLTQGLIFVVWMSKADLGLPGSFFHEAQLGNGLHKALLLWLVHHRAKSHEVT